MNTNNLNWNILQNVCLAGAAVTLLTGCQDYLIFNTETKVGVDISQSADQEPHVTIGYKRVAIVSMPSQTNILADANSTNDAYSVIGTFAMDVKPVLSSTSPGGGITICQLFATGNAAREMATNPQTAGVFGRTLAAIGNLNTNAAK